jgi:hypothetical protein
VGLGDESALAGCDDREVCGELDEFEFSGGQAPAFRSVEAGRALRHFVLLVVVPASSKLDGWTLAGGSDAMNDKRPPRGRALADGA